MIGLLLLLVGVTMSLGNAWRLSVPTTSFEVREVARDGTVSWTPGRFSQRVHILRLACVSCRWGDSPLVWRMKHRGGNVGTGLFLFARVASVVGRGPWRESLGAGAILGVLLWAEFGIL